MAPTTEAALLYRPPTAELRFLPEGPQPCGPNRFSWVSIQHGADSQVGAINVFDLDTSTNQTFPLAGRPGFAFPTDVPGEFLVGLERHVQRVNIQSGAMTPLSGPVDADVSGTIINDGVECQTGLIFGTKDLEFKTQKAGLYFWRQADRQLVRLRSDQVCSNGKVILSDGSTINFLDIDTPTRQIVQYELNPDTATATDPRQVVDLRHAAGFPDGMVAAPDGQSVIVAFYNPDDIDAGEARQYSLETGEVERVWRTPLAPRVTCPLLMPTSSGLKLVLTTAVETMDDQLEARLANSGSLFIADTPW